MGRIDDRLAELGLTLPEPMEPPGNFRLVTVHAGVAYVAGHPPISGTEILVHGVVGEITTDNAMDKDFCSADRRMSCNVGHSGVNRHESEVPRRLHRLGQRETELGKPVIDSTHCRKL